MKSDSKSSKPEKLISDSVISGSVISGSGISDTAISSSDKTNLAKVVSSLVSSNNLAIPRHIAIIMDGNGRWAKASGLPRLEGHKAGVESVKRIVESCLKQGIRYLTLFSFSTENWRRSPTEVNGLMNLLNNYLDSELPKLIEYGIRLRTIGNISELPKKVQKGLERNCNISKNNNKLDLVLALNYGSREELTFAMQKIAREVQSGSIRPDDIQANDISRNLWTSDIPDPDLLIRSSGEMRISNFLLWQLAYTEIIVVKEYWPEFNDDTLTRCLIEYAKRERRFGFTSEQIEKGEHKNILSKLGYSLA